MSGTTGSAKKFKIIKRKVLNDNTALQNTKQTVEAPDLHFKSSQNGLAFADPGHKQSFNENSFSIFDIDSDELANTYKDAHTSHLKRLSISNHAATSSPTRKSKLESDLENVDSRLQSIMARYKHSAGGTLQSDGMDLSRAPDSSDAVYCRSRQNDHLIPTSSSTATSTLLENDSANDPNDILKRIRQRFNLDSSSTASFAQSLPAARTNYPFYCPPDEGIPTQQNPSNFSVNVGMTYNNHNDLAAFLADNVQPEHPTDNTSLFIGLRTKSLNETSLDSRKRTETISKSIIANHSDKSSSPIAQESPRELSRSHISASNGHALTLEALERTPDRNLVTSGREPWTNMMNASMPEFLEVSTQTMPDLVMEDMACMTLDDTQIVLKRNSACEMEVAGIEATPTSSSVQSFIKGIVFDLIPIVESTSALSEEPPRVANLFQDSETQTSTTIVYSMETQTDATFLHSIESQTENVLVPITTCFHSIETQTESRLVPIPSTYDVSLSINSGTQTVISLFVDAAIQVEIPRQLQGVPPEIMNEEIAKMSNLPISLSNTDYACQTDALQLPTAAEIESTALPFLTDESRLEDIVLKVLKREWLQYEKRIRIAGHLKEKEKEENREAFHNDPNKPRTDLKFDTDRAITNHRLSVKSVNPDIISDIDSIDEMVVDLDSSHEKKLLAKMERNRHENLDSTGEEISYYDNSDLYSDISRNQPTVATGAETSRKDSDLSSELSSLVEMSPSHSEEELQKGGDIIKSPSIIKLTSTVAKRVSISNPAPILAASDITPSIAASQPNSTAPPVAETNFVQHVDMDEIPDIFSVTTSTSASKLPIEASVVPNNHLRDKSYDEESIDDMSEISLPGLDPLEKTKDTFKREQQTIPVAQVLSIAAMPSSHTKAEAIANETSLHSQASRPVDIDNDHSCSSSINSQKMVSEVDKLKYEKEILDLKLRIHRIERENNEMVSFTSEKLKQYEYLENLAKSEMLNYPNKDSSIVQSQQNASAATITSSANNLSIYKQYEDLRKGSEMKIENLNIRLKEEISKTARFTVLQIQNGDQAKEIAALVGEVEDLKEQNRLIMNQLSIAKRETLAAQQQERDRLAASRVDSASSSAKDLGEIGFVHEQKKKWQGHSRSSSNLINGSKDRLRSKSGDLELEPTVQDQQIDALKKDLEKVSSSLSTEMAKSSRIEKSFKLYQQSVEKIASQLAAPKLSFEEKDAIQAEIHQLDQTEDGAFTRVKQSFEKVLGNIHHAELQDHEKDMRHTAELEKLNGRISEVESASLKQWDDFQYETTDLKAKIDSLQANLNESKKKNSDLAAEILTKESTLKRTQSLWEATQADLNKSVEALKALQVESSKKSNMDEKYAEKLEEYEKKILKLQNDIYAAETQSNTWKRELEQQIETARSLQLNLEESTKSVRELSRKANQNDDWEKLNNDLQNEIQVLTCKIMDMQLAENVPAKELDDANLKNEELYEKLTEIAIEMAEMKKNVEHENEVNAKLSARLAEALKELSGRDNVILELSLKLKETASELEVIKHAEINVNNTNLKLEKLLATLEKEKREILVAKDIEIENIKLEATSLANQVTLLKDRLSDSEKLGQDLTQTLKAFQNSETLIQSTLNETKQQLVRKNLSLESLNKNLAADLAREQGEVEQSRHALSELTRQFHAIKSELDAQFIEKKSLEEDVSLKNKRLHEETLAKLKLEAELVKITSNKNNESNGLFEELEALKSQLALKERELKHSRLENVKMPTYTGSEDSDVIMIEKEKFKLECKLKMVERELFNEKTRFTTADLKWQETEHKCSAIERTNQLLEKELNSVRLKYEHLLGEQTKMDLNTQETVMKLQTKLGEQRQMLLDFQLVEKENQTLHSHANQMFRSAEANLKRDGEQKSSLSSTHVTNINAEIVDRLLILETEVQRLQKQKQQVEPLGTQTQQTTAEIGDRSNFDSIKRQIQEEFNQGVQDVNCALEKVFQTRRDVDREREINQEIMRKNYEKRLEELSKQIKRRY